MSMSKTTTKQRKQPTLNLWCCVGEGSEGENFGQDMSALADYLYECRIDFADIHGQWFNSPRRPSAYAERHKLHVVPSTGFLTEARTEVSLFWGDDEGTTMIQSLSKPERNELETEMLERAGGDGRIFIVAPTTGQKADGDKLHKVCLVNKNEGDGFDVHDVYDCDAFIEVALYVSLRGATQFCESIGVNKPVVL